MSKVEFSLKIEPIAQYADEDTAMQAAIVATQSDNSYRYKPAYSVRANKWLVSVRDEHGNLLGYLHPILGE